MTHRVLLRLARSQALADLGAPLDLAVGRLGERLRLLRRDVACDDDHGVVGRIEPPIECQRICPIERLDLVVPADHRAMIRMIEKQRGGYLLAEPRARIVADPQVPFLQHDLKLRHDVGVGEHQAAHAVGLELHHARQMLARQALEIGGEVGRGERVLLAADGGERLREPAGRVLGGAFEHQMFEEMGDAGFADRLVGRADLVPDHVGHDRGAVVRNHDKLEAVRERVMGGRAGRRGVERGRC